MSRRKSAIPREVTVEMWLFLIALLSAVWFYQAGIIAELLGWISALGPLLGGFFAGAAFSTFITTPFAIAGFVQMGAFHTLPIWQIALMGSIGATMVDLLLVKGIRSPLASLIVRAAVGHDVEAFKSKMRKKPFLRWGAAVFGGFLMAIPLPTDELGVVFFGASGLRAIHIIPIIAVANFCGVYAIVTASQSFVG